MRIAVFVIAFAALATRQASAQTPEESSFCAALRKTSSVNLVGNWERLFYRSGTQIVELPTAATISKKIDRLFFYIPVDQFLGGQRSVLNVKFVFKLAKPLRREQTVDLYNNGWSTTFAQRAKSNCAGVTVTEYENFHLEQGPSYCLPHYFHQKEPEYFNTLATPQRRQSFAFDDMIDIRRSNLFSDFFGKIGPRPAQAAEREQSTSPNSYVRSWIHNFNYGTEPFRCVGFSPNFIEGAEAVHVRITHHGTNVAATPFPKNWTLTLEK